MARRATEGRLVKAKRQAIQSADEYVLSQIPWQFFCGMSFKQDPLPERIRITIFFAMFRELADSFKADRRTLLWAVRQERNGGRWHFHYLLAGLPRRAVTDKTCRLIEAIGEMKGAGISDARIFDPTRGAIAYLAEGIGKPIDGIALIESAKFGANGNGILYSESDWDVRNHRRNP